MALRKSSPFRVLSYVIACTQKSQLSVSNGVGMRIVRKPSDIATHVSSCIGTRRFLSMGSRSATRENYEGSAISYLLPRRRSYRSSSTTASPGLDATIQPPDVPNGSDCVGNVDTLAQKPPTIHPSMKKVVSKIVRLDDARLAERSWQQLLACRGEILGFNRKPGPSHERLGIENRALTKEAPRIESPSLSTHPLAAEPESNHVSVTRDSAELPHTKPHVADPIEPALRHLSDHPRFIQEAQRDLFLRSLLQTPTGGMQSKLDYLQLILSHMPVVPTEATVQVLAGEVLHRARPHQVKQLFDFVEKGPVAIEQQIVFGLLSASAKHTDHSQLEKIVAVLRNSRAVREAPAWKNANDIINTKLAGLDERAEVAHQQAQLRGHLYTMYAQTIYAGFAEEYHHQGRHELVTQMVGPLLQTKQALGPRLAASYITSVMHDHSYFQARVLMRWCFDQGLNLKARGDAKGCAGISSEVFWDINQRASRDIVTAYGYAWLDTTPGLAPAKTRVVGFRQADRFCEAGNDSNGKVCGGTEDRADEPLESIHVGYKRKPPVSRDMGTVQRKSEWDLMERGRGKGMQAMPPLSMAIVDAFLNMAVQLERVNVRVPWDILGHVKVLGLSPTHRTYMACTTLAAQSGALTEFEALRKQLGFERNNGNANMYGSQYNLELMMRLKFVVTAGIAKHYDAVRKVMSDVTCMDTESVRQSLLLADGPSNARLTEAAQGELLLAVMESCSRAEDRPAFAWTASLYRELIPTKLYTEGFYIKLLNSLRFQPNSTVADVAALAKECRRNVPSHGAPFYGAFLVTLGSIVQESDVHSVLLDVLKLYENNANSSKGRGGVVGFESGPYNAAVYICAKRNLTELSWEFVERMRATHVKIHPITIKPILVSYMEAGDFHAVCEKFRFAVERYRIYPNPHIIDMVLEGI
ncbi:hypothetical protein SARC_05771 [Sphaeroforma arctica JP610]|uniref:Uncharacterized protein n=1 Tax=Sphaeroforma arctica JP610 TaxID=667725 RepID=A0A0L0FYL1_9EUKA|nr:hypothetical protein SARC_05771 [Sphaeroforma arctica JP610]KNC81920.1 hypothetical protein SARC_05771 [Sphaeroforma arctica JP610]|eukprot:XP_014155822.1 hypothetical protein SARC_05771 [Sphaeroforma arctica JP610]